MTNKKVSLIYKSECIPRHASWDSFQIKEKRDNNIDRFEFESCFIRIFFDKFESMMKISCQIGSMLNFCYSSVSWKSSKSFLLSTEMLSWNNGWFNLRWSYRGWRKTSPLIILKSCKMSHWKKVMLLFVAPSVQCPFIFGGILWINFCPIILSVFVQTIEITIDIDSSDREPFNAAIIINVENKWENTWRAHRHRTKTHIAQIQTLWDSENERNRGKNNGLSFNLP